MAKAAKALAKNKAYKAALANYKKNYKKAAKAAKALKAKVGNEVKVKKGVTPLAILNKVILKEKNPPFA